MKPSFDYRLIVRTPGGQAHEFPLIDRETRMGRGRACDLVLDSPFVSRGHARIVQDSEGFVVIDEGSTNGVTLNGVRVPETAHLREGDELQIADITMTFTAKGLGDTTITPLLPGDQGRAFRCDSATWEVWLAGKRLDTRFSVQEFEMLCSLARHPGSVCSREELGDAIWGKGNYDNNMLYQLVHRLRDKLGEQHRDLIESVGGVGYRIKAPGRS